MIFFFFSNGFSFYGYFKEGKFEFGGWEGCGVGLEESDIEVLRGREYVGGFLVVK